MASTSASSVQKSFKYDAFLSFRGEDTRKTFVDHLYHALHQKGIIIYKDDENIVKGESISEQLIKSIEESRFYIIVFSKNYASSSWCLEELVKIMKCQKMTGHTAYPIFYDVEPTEVRHQSGAVGEAFEKLVGKRKRTLKDVDQENKDHVGRWKNTLKEAADLAGIELKTSFNGHEAKFIQQIVQDISLKLHFTNSSIDGKLVGMERRVKSVLSSLETGSEVVRIIGIKGIGGGGKTTLARAIFDLISIWFEGASFVENVREISKGSSTGLKKLQKQVLKDVLNDQSIDVTSVSDGKNKMKRMMPGRKALVVLDDVDDIVQLEALAGELTWFKPGSRIIITTRDEQVLIAQRVNFIHDANLLSNEEAICLFSSYAFGREIPIQGYEQLSRKVVRYAAGLPLTIKVLGSHLCGRSELEWEDSIERLKKIPLKETLEKLELSYNGLEDDHKEIFLDVVCILKGKEKYIAIKILESCGFNARFGLRVLEQKSLITISASDCLCFHDHIEEMGWNVVRRLHPDEPNKHSRLWIREEIKDILVNESGTEETRSITLHAVDDDPRTILKGLRKMNKLRLLRVFGGIKDWKVNEVSEYLPDALRCISWHGYPFRSLFKTFWLNKLVNFGMCWDSNLQLWEVGQRKVFDKLRYVELCSSKLRTFDLRMTPHLETLDLSDSWDFIELHMLHECPKLKSLNLSGSKMSTLNLGMTPHLEELNLKGCFNLQEIHAPVGCLKNLFHLNLSGCSRYEYFSVGKQNALPGRYSLAESTLAAWSPSICPLHPNSNLPKLKFNCKYRETLPSSSGDLEKLLSFGLCACTDLGTFSASVSGLRHFRKLTIEFCNILQVANALGQIQSLEKLSLWMKGIKHLPESICMLKHLKYLYLSCCISLQDIPNDICKIKNLSHLDLSYCFQLQNLPSEIGCLECLEMLNLEKCRSLRHIPNSICKMKSLTYLNLSYCILVEKLPEELGSLECLEELNLTHCRSLRDIPNSICKMKKLTDLNLFGCILVEILPKELGCLERLEKLNLSHCRSLRDIPNSICKMKSLTNLSLFGCILVENCQRNLGV